MSYQSIDALSVQCIPIMGDEILKQRIFLLSGSMPNAVIQASVWRGFVDCLRLRAQLWVRLSKTKPTKGWFGPTDLHSSDSQQPTHPIGLWVTFVATRLNPITADVNHFCGKNPRRQRLAYTVYIWVHKLMENLKS